jgi:predicted nucleic acid-binding protein
MSADLPSFVLDSFALLSHFQNEKSSGRIVSLLEQAQQGECRLLMSLINLGEVCYLIERRRGFQAVQLAIAVTENLPIEILPVDREIVLAAAHLKAQYPISYADAFAAAAAQTYSATLITGDPEFKALKNVVELEWLIS